MINNQVIHDENQVGDAIVAHFAKVSSLDNFYEEFVFNMVQTEMQKINFSSENEKDYNCSFSFLELEAVLSKTPDTSPGPDEIPYVLLRKLNIEQKKILFNFYNYIWKSSSVPKQWKQAILIPLLKPGEKN